MQTDIEFGNFFINWKIVPEGLKLGHMYPWFGLKKKNRKFWKFQSILFGIIVKEWFILEFFKYFIFKINLFSFWERMYVYLRLAFFKQ